ncbi:MAG: YbjQ family protein [Phycisphaerae bacterium]|nr:YbjQ family protein [Phycisphaerae bacterium]
MWTCPNCNEEIADQFTQCWKCVGKEEGFEVDEPALTGQDIHPDTEEFDVRLSTTDSIPGEMIAHSIGLVCGETILGSDFYTGILAEIADTFGGRSGAYESKLKYGRNIAINEMSQKANSLDADAIVGIRFNYETIKESMLIICVSGTAIKLAQ